MFDHVLFGCYTEKYIFILQLMIYHTRGKETNHCTTTYNNMNPYAFWYSNLKNYIALSLARSLLFKLSLLWLFLGL